MIKKFFQGLNKSRVSYILISGQAAVLYGAATFSEDIDLWIRPKAEDWDKFLSFINELRARIYKLTPAIRMDLVKRGHGFHFQLPSGSKKLPFWFLDVMGVVPRVGSFERCAGNVVYQKTDWGKLPVIGIRDLVEIKKTRRLEDYSIISNLVNIEYKALCKRKITLADWKWILTNSFEIEDILYYLRSHDLSKAACRAVPRKCLPYCLKATAVKRGGEKYIESASREIALEIERLRAKDREYWGPVIKELKDLKEKDLLLGLGSRPPESVE